MREALRQSEKRFKVQGFTAWALSFRNHIHLLSFYYAKFNLKNITPPQLSQIWHADPAHHALSNLLQRHKQGQQIPKEDQDLLLVKERSVPHRTQKKVMKVMIHMTTQTWKRTRLLTHESVVKREGYVPQTV